MILTLLNSMSIILCIYVLVSKKYKTDDKRVTLLYLCLNLIFMRRLWLVLDPTFTVSVMYSAINFVAFIALYLITSLVKKDKVADDTNISCRIFKILRPVKLRFICIVNKIKHIYYNKIKNK